MTVRNKQELREVIVRDITTNAQHDISGAKLASLLTDMVDSWPNVSDGGEPETPIQLATCGALVGRLARRHAKRRTGAGRDRGNERRHAPGRAGVRRDAVRLYAVIPADRWPLPGRPEMSGISGGVSMELFANEGANVVIRSNELNAIIRGDGPDRHLVAGVRETRTRGGTGPPGRVTPTASE